MTRRLPRLGLPLAIIVMLAAATSIVRSQEAPANLSPRERAQQAKRERLWNTQWPRFAERFQTFDGKYYYFPNFDLRNSNSLGMTEAQVRESMTVRYVPNANRVLNPVVDLRIDSPDEDVQAAMRTLPAYRGGEYGYIASCSIDEELGDGSAKVSEITLLDSRQLKEDLRDAEQLVKREVGSLPNLRTDPDKVLRFMFRHREKVYELENAIAEDPRPLVLRGFTGEGDVPKLPRRGRWRGPIHIALLGEEDGKMIGVPPAALKPVKTEEQFLELLAQRKLDREAFIDMFEKYAAQRISVQETDRRIANTLAGLSEEAKPEAGVDLRQSFEELDKPGRRP